MWWSRSSEFSRRQMDAEITSTIIPMLYEAYESWQVHRDSQAIFFNFILFLNHKLSDCAEQVTFLCVSFKKVFIGVQLIYKVVLTSGVQQNESVIHIHISTHILIIFPYRPLQVLSRVTCAMQQVLISYLLYIQQCVCAN